MVNSRFIRVLVQQPLLSDGLQEKDFMALATNIQPGYSSYSNISVRL
jgi:hypothetical protein